jgi:hypothetical protein
MRIRYNNTIDDLVAFNAFHYANSPTAKRVWRLVLWGGALLVLVGTTMTGRYSLAVRIAGGLTGTAFYVVATLLVRRLTMGALIRRFYAEGSQKVTVGEREMEVTEQGLVERTDYNEMRSAWGAIERIETTPLHTFIYIGPLMAFVIPHGAVTEGDLRAFLVELKRHYRPDATLESATTADLTP